MPGSGKRRSPETADLQQDAGRRPIDWGAAIRRRRRALRLTQRDVAALAGVAERTVIAVETGSAGVRLRSLLSVLSVLGLRVRIERGQGVVAGDV